MQQAMYPQSKWVLDLLPSEGKKALAVHGGIFFLVVLPVVVTYLWKSEVIIALALVLAILIAYLLSSFIVMLNTYRQKEAIFLSNAGDALVVIDRSWKIELWNKTAEVLTGWNADEVIGKSFRETVKFIREGDLTANIAFIEEAMVYGRVGTLEDHTFLIRKDGLQIPIGDSAAPLFDPLGAIVGAIIVFRDKSREHDLENVREEFMTLATRELLAPLEATKDSIEHMLGALTLTEVDIKAREYSEKIQHENEQIYSLVRTMCDVLNVEQGKCAVTPVPVSLPEFADTIVSECTPTAETGKITVQRNYDNDIPLVNMDARILSITLRNLLENAIKFTPEGGTVSLHLKKESTNVLVSVVDTGYGIPKAQQTKVFSKLFRCDNVKSRRIKGVGLGLYLVKMLVERAGGKIWFESEEDKGSTFVVSFPLSGMTKKEGVENLH